MLNNCFLLKQSKLWKQKASIQLSLKLLKQKKTVIVKNIDSYLCDFDCESLISSINEINSPWLKISSLFKFQSGKTFKMECETQQMARLCIERGFFILNLSIPPRMLSIDEYIKVDFCYKCYSINEHFVQDCPKEHDYKVCSECTSVNHTYRDCASTSKKCINCSGNHSTMSQRCWKKADQSLKCLPSQTPQFLHINWTKKHLNLFTLIGPKNTSISSP